jgi:hypothetical protein
MAGIGAAACVAACLVLRQFMQDSRASQAASLAEMRDFNAKLLAGMQRPAEPTAPANSNWTKVRVKLVDAESGQPVMGADVSLGPPPTGSQGRIVMRKISSADGAAEFDSVALGDYRLEIESGERQFRLLEDFPIGPAFSTELVYRVPAAPGPGATRLHLNLPEERPDDWMYFVIVHASPVVLDGHEWRWTKEGGSFILDRSGELKYQVSDVQYGSEYAGLPVHTFAVENPGSLPALPFRLLHIEALRIGSAADSSASKIAAGRLTAISEISFQPRQAVHAQSSTIGGLLDRLELPPEFMAAFARAAMREGFEPLPAGMRLITVASAVQPQSQWLDNQEQPDLLFSFLPRGVVELPDENRRTVRLVGAVQVLGAVGDPDSLQFNGHYTKWRYSLLVTDQQAELIELARTARDPDFRVVHPVSKVASPQTAAESTTIEQLRREIGSGQTPSDG